MDTPPLILASASPRRAQLLRQLELRFEVLPAQAEESVPEHFTPRETAMLNAYHKARRVAKAHPDCLVLGADTVVCLGTTVFGKPATREEAHATLARLQGHTHQVITGVCLLHLRAHEQEIFAESTDVTFRKLDEMDIAQYLSLVDPLDKAGGYAIQDHGELIVEEIHGSFSNVVGLPMERLQQALQRWTREIGE